MFENTNFSATIENLDQIFLTNTSFWSNYVTVAKIQGFTAGKDFLSMTYSLMVTKEYAYN